MECLIGWHIPNNDIEKTFFLNRIFSVTTNEFLTYHSGCVIDDFFRCKITFITNQQFVNVFACITFNFFQPLLNIIEWFLIRTIVYYNNTMSATIIRRCNGAETFLTSSIPLFYQVENLMLEKKNSKFYELFNRKKKSLNSRISKFNETYDLQFDCLVVQFNRSNFLNDKFLN